MSLILLKIHVLLFLGRPFVGLLFTGIMITPDGPKVLEYNVRCGDPETQTMLLLIESDLTEVILACAEGRLNKIDLRIADSFAANVVISAEGYPGAPRPGDKIEIEDHSQGNNR